MGYKLTEGTSIENVDGCTIVLTGDDGAADLNSSAVMFLSAFLESNTNEEAISLLSKLYEIKDANVADTAHEALDKFIECGILEEV